MRDRIVIAAWWATTVVLIYLLTALWAYWTRHPELTQMQVMLDFWEAARWR